MRYLWSTKPFEGSINKKSLYISGPITENSKKIELVEGFIIDEKKENGAYNILSYDLLGNSITVKNDKAGTLPLYYYVQNEKIILSNSFWEIVELLEPKERLIDLKELKFLMFQFGSNMNGKTIIEGIRELTTGSELKVDINSCTFSCKRSYSLESTGEISDINIAVEQAINAINDGYKYISNKYPQAVFGFGNSGGFDSRMIPAFTYKNKMTLHGVTVVDQLKWRTSVTEKNAKGVQDIFGFENTFNYFDPKNLDYNLDLDISNNTLGPSQILKNHYYGNTTNKYSHYISGGNGYIIGGNWQRFNTYSDKDLASNIIAYHNKLKTYNYKELHDGLSQFLSQEDLNYFKSLKANFYQENITKKPLDIVRSFHIQSMNKHSALGGYESQNGTLPTYNMYYPFLLDTSLKWKDSLLFNRSLLRGLISTLERKLQSIPSQELVPLNKLSETKLESFIRKVKIKIFYTQGLNYKKWVKNEDLILFFKKIWNRENPLWDQMFPNAQYKPSMINDYFMGVDIIKAKRIVDIIHFQEWKNLKQMQYKVNEI